MKRSEAAAGAFLLVTLLLGVGWGAHAPASWDVDNIAPGSVLRGLSAHFGPGWYSSYGPAPYLAIGLLYVPVLIAFRLAGELGTPSSVFPWGFAHPAFSIGLLIVWARIACVAMALGVAVLAIRERWAGGARGGWLVPVLLAGSPAFVYYARTSNVDMFYLFFLALAFHFAERGGSRRSLAAAGAAAALAICSKEQSAPLAAIAALAAMARGFSSGGAGASRGRAVLAVALGGIAAYVIVWGLPFNASGWLAHHRFLFEQARYPREYPATPAGALSLARRATGLLPLTLGWPVLLGALAALLFRRSGPGLAARAWAQAVYAVGFLGVIGYVYPRFLLPLILLALPLAVRGWNEAFERWPRLRGALALTLIATVATGGPLLGIAQLRDTREVARERLAARAGGAGAGTLSVQIVGNPRFQARPPAAFAVTVLSPDTLAGTGIGPSADYVMLSSFDRYLLEGDPVLRHGWLDRLQDPEGDYRLLWDIPPPKWARAIRGLPVSPVIWIWTRRAGTDASPP